MNLWKNIQETNKNFYGEKVEGTELMMMDRGEGESQTFHYNLFYTVWFLWLYHLVKKYKNKDQYFWRVEGESMDSSSCSYVSPCRPAPFPGDSLIFGTSTLSQ